MFTKAVRRRAKLRLAMSGPSGSGKTYSALMLAKGIGGRIAVLDTEHGSASLYSHLVDFDTMELTPPYTPERYVDAIRAAAEAGYDTLILDSITHEWKGAGGILEIVDGLSRTKYKGNSYAAWGEADPRHRRLVDAMLSAPMHVIATMRSKTAYVEGERNGKKTFQKAGMAPEQRDGMEYEFTVVFDLNNDGNIAVASKDRTTLFRDPLLLTEQTGRLLADWLDSGADTTRQAATDDSVASEIDRAISMLPDITERAGLVALRDSIRGFCEERDEREQYPRFVAALKRRLAEIEQESTV